MNTERICPSCRKPLPPDVPLGLCPECLIKAGFQTGTEPGSPASGFVPPPVEQIARLFPQLEVLELVGKGGMGAVYRARQPALDRFVALKILRPSTANDSGFAERFNREARALARLNHPNIVAVHDFGRVDGLHYLIMEFVDGANLREVERAGRLSPEQALSIVPQICEALQFAHNEGIVHRDIKPENLLLDKRGRVKITDFGIAKILGVSSGKVSLTGAKDVVGTPHYMAPEQIEKPQTVDHRADIYSLGVVFYEMLTGELPLGKFAPPSRKVQVDVRLDEVVLHALEKEPERRYQQASVLRADVETIAGNLPAILPRSKSQWVRLFETATAFTFTSPAAIRALDFSLFGLIACIVSLAAVQVVRTPWIGWCIAVAGLLCLAVPLALALAFESLARRAAGAQPPRDHDPSAEARIRNPTSPPDTAVITEACQQVRGPAIGLLASVALQLVVFFALVGYAIPAVAREANSAAGHAVVSGMAALSLIAAVVVLSGATTMLKLRHHSLALVASVIAMFAGPAAILGLPFGIWSLVVLNRREVREAFAANKPRGESSETGSPAAVQVQLPHSPWGFRIGLTLVVLTGLILLGIVLPNVLPRRTPNVTGIAAKTIREEVGRQLHEAGASYDDLRVAVAEERDSATPFTVNYRGLRNFKYTHDGQPDPHWPASASGQFIMNYIGGGQWQGKLGDTQFTVQVGHTDNIDLPFVKDPEILGEWASVDFVAAPSEFNPDKPKFPDAGRNFKGLTFLENGKALPQWWKWTKGVVIHTGDKTANRYEIREIKGQSYLFMEWKNGGVMLAGMRPQYSVLRKTSDLPAALSGDQPPLSVTGRVTDAFTGAPIAHARVDDNRYGASPKKAPQQAWTDTNGNYELKTWTEEHTLAASAPGYETKLAVLMTSFWGTERSARMDFQLRPRNAGASAQTSTPELAAKLRTAAPVMEGIRGAWTEVVEAIRVNEAPNALAALRTLEPRIQEFHRMMAGTSLEAGAADALEKLKPLKSALETGDLAAAQPAMEAMASLGRSMEAQVKAITDASQAPSPEAVAGVVNPVVLQRDDGKQTGVQSIATSGHAVEFDRPGPARYVEAVHIFCSRYGTPEPPQEDFHLYLLNEQQQVLCDAKFPYSMIERGEPRWYTLRTPSIEVPEKFLVALDFNPHQTRGVYLAYTATNGSVCHSLIGLPGDGYEFWKPVEWMVRVSLCAEPTRAKGFQRLADWKPPVRHDPFANCRMVTFGGEKSEGMQSYGGQGPAIHFRLSEHFTGASVGKNASLKGVRLYASRYGAGYPPEETKLRVIVRDSKGTTLFETGFVYAQFGYRAGWVDLVFDKAVVISEPEQLLTIAFDPEATQRKGIYFHFQKDPATSHSLVGSVRTGFTEMPDREWMLQAAFE